MEFIATFNNNIFTEELEKAFVDCFFSYNYGRFKEANCHYDGKVEKLEYTELHFYLPNEKVETGEIRHFIRGENKFWDLMDKFKFERRDLTMKYTNDGKRWIEY